MYSSIKVEVLVIERWQFFSFHVSACRAFVTLTHTSADMINNGSMQIRNFVLMYCIKLFSYFLGSRVRKLPYYPSFLHGIVQEEPFSLANECHALPKLISLSLLLDAHFVPGYKSNRNFKPSHSYHILISNSKSVIRQYHCLNLPIESLKMSFERLRHYFQLIQQKYIISQEDNAQMSHKKL